MNSVRKLVKEYDAALQTYIAACEACVGLPERQLILTNRIKQAEAHLLERTMQLQDYLPVVPQVEVVRVSRRRHAHRCR